MRLIEFVKDKQKSQTNCLAFYILQLTFVTKGLQLPI